MQGHTKVFLSFGGKFLKRIQHTYITHYETDMSHSHIHKHVLYKKNSRNATIILHTGSYKSFPILWRKCLNHILMYLYCTKCNEINICHSHIHKHALYKKWYKHYKNFKCGFTQTFSDPMRENF